MLFHYAFIPFKSCYPHIPFRNFLRIQCKFFVFKLEILIFTAKIWDSKIYDVYRIDTSTEGEFFWWYRNRYRKKLVPEKSLGTGIDKIWFRKKVPEPVSEKFGTGKKYRYRYRKYLVPEKSIGTGIVFNFGYRHTLVQRERCKKNRKKTNKCWFVCMYVVRK